MAAVWLFDALRKNFYLMLPSELALDDSDPEPRWLLTHGVPVFMLLICVEFSVSKAKGINLYRLNDFVASVSLGTLQNLIRATFPLALQLAGLQLNVSSYR